MDLTYASILVLAAMVFVLSGMVGYVYWRQTVAQQNIQSLSIVVSSLVAPAPEIAEAPNVSEVAEEEIPSDDDDRVSVEHVTEPPPAQSSPESAPVDVDDLQSKTAVQLRELLGQKGIPFGKRDSKSALIELLKATA